MRNVEWGEYKLSNLFVKKTIKGVPKSKENLSENINGYHVFGQNIKYQYPQKVLMDKKYLQVVEDTSPILAYASSVGEIGIITESFYRTGDNGAFQGLFSKEHKFSKNELLFVLPAIKKHFDYFGYDTGMASTMDLIVKLPTKNHEINYEFMNSFIAELETERVAELSDYLTVNGFDNYELSNAEWNAVNSINKLEWKEHRIGTLFEKVKTKKLSYKARKLPNEAQGDYDLPCLTSSFNNQGLNYYVPRIGATVLKDVITIPQNSDVYRAYYQSSEFTVLSDAYAIDWKYDDRKLTREQYLFMVMCINKVTDLPIYSYKNKLGGWNVVKDKYILLPEKDREIDFSFMHTFISALEKLAIKDVVDYVNDKPK